MPTISMFYGILVMIYFEAASKHKRPHIHVRYQEHKAALAISNGHILSGSFPKTKLKMVQVWMELHREELMANWMLAKSGQDPYKINPLQ